MQYHLLSGAGLQTEVLIVFSKVRIGFSKVLRVFTNVLTVFTVIFPGKSMAADYRRTYLWGMMMEWWTVISFGTFRFYVPVEVKTEFQPSAVDILHNLNNLSYLLNGQDSTGIWCTASLGVG